MTYNNFKMCSTENKYHSEISERELTLMNKHHNVTIYTYLLHPNKNFIYKDAMMLPSI